VKNQVKGLTNYKELDKKLDEKEYTPVEVTTYRLSIKKLRLISIT